MALEKFQSILDFLFDIILIETHTLQSLIYTLNKAKQTLSHTKNLNKFTMKKEIELPKGCKISNVSIEGEKVIVIYESDKPKFKKGDVIVYDIVSTWISIVDTNDMYFVSIGSNGQYSEKDSVLYNESGHRLATEQEKKLFLLDKMHEIGKDFNFETCEVVDYVWKPKEGERIHYIMSDAICGCNRNNSHDKIIEQNNYFKTYELAQIALDKRNKLFKTLKHS